MPSRLTATTPWREKRSILTSNWFRLVNPEARLEIFPT
jgi:hypothetical protein